MNAVEILVGPIASGKSTYARQRAQDGAIVVNDDAIVLAVHGGDYSLYDPQLKPLYKAVEIAIATTALAMGRDVVIDRGCNMTIESRRRWVGLAHSFDAVAEAVIFPFTDSLTNAQRRMAHDSRGITGEDWMRVYHEQEQEYQPPTTAEGFDRVQDIAGLTYGA